jgi:sortase A
MVTAGLVLLLFAAYEMYGTGLATGRAQRELRGQLQQRWDDSGSRPGRPAASDAVVGPARQPAAPPVRGGQPLAILRIPRFGRGWQPRVVVEGVTAADLAKGPGHYPGTALPGQVGNFAVAGHRATHGNGFFRMNEMRPGDAVVVEAADRWYTYRVLSARLVDPSDIAVIDPVPDRPGQAPTERLLTLTTCDPWYSATHRLVVAARLQSSTAKSAGPPAALAG